MIFKTWTFQDIRFLAMPVIPTKGFDGEVCVVDEAGNFYGRFPSIDTYRDYQKKGIAVIPVATDRILWVRAE